MKCGLPAIQVIAILTGSFEAIQALERERLVRVRTDIGVVCAVITGSFPTADAAFDPARNALELARRNAAAHSGFPSHHSPRPSSAPLLFVALTRSVSLGTRNSQLRTQIVRRADALREPMAHGTQLAFAFVAIVNN